MIEKVKFVTLGCEKNLVDSEIMGGLVHEQGFLLVDDNQGCYSHCYQYLWIY